MPRKRKLGNPGERCRFCLSQDACMSQLFVERLRQKLDNLEKCCSIEIQDKPKYPKNICYVCLYKLEMWDDFKEQIIKTNKKLDARYKPKTRAEPNAESLSQDAYTTADDLFSEDDQHKRPRIVVSEVKASGLSIEAPTELPQSPAKILDSSVSLSSQALHVKEALDDTITTLDITSDGVVTSQSQSKVSPASRSQQSDGSVTGGRKVRPKKEREALTKRWEARQNALLAATGEAATESDSDYDSQLSPVQKARAKINYDRGSDGQSKAMQRALKNLETNLSEKYQVNQDAVVEEVRRTRSRRGNLEEQKPQESKVVITTKSPKGSLSKSVKAGKKLQESTKLEEKVEDTTVEKSKVSEKQEKQKSEKMTEKENEKPAEKNDEQVKITEKAREEGEKESEIEQDNDDHIEIGDTEGDVPISVIEVDSQSTTSQDKESDIEIVEVDNELSITDTVEEPESENFKPQTVKTEISLGGSTYIVTATLDLPNPSAQKSDISLKTNGINIDATNKDGRKIDLMNAAQLQKIGSNERSTDGNNETDVDIENCLRMQVEGMEKEALQRVQLELTNFVKDDVKKRLLENATTDLTEPKNMKFKDSYESLDHQLKTIVEYVLRKNYESDKEKSTVTVSNHQRISHDFIEAAKSSPVFQPKVAVPRMSLGKICKNYSINNKHVLELVKRERGLVGPLSRALGKRKCVLPKKFDDYAVCLTDKQEQEKVKKQEQEKTKKPEQEKTKKQDAKPKITVKSLPMKSPNDRSTPTEIVINDSEKDEEMGENNDVQDDESLIPKHKIMVECPAKNTDKESGSESVKSVAKDNPTKSAKNVVKKVVVDSAKKPVPEVAKKSEPIENSVKEPFDIAVDELVEDIAKEPVMKAAKESTETKKQTVILVTSPPAKPATPVTSPPDSELKPLPSIQNRANPVITVTTPTPKSTVRKIAPKKPATPAAEAPTPGKQATPKATPKRQRHICGLCGKELMSKEEAEIHVKSHKLESNSTPAKKQPTALATPQPATPSPVHSTPMVAMNTQQKTKPKLMRCKKCQAIVEAKNVKSHVCNSVKYNCTMCECSFGAEHLLVSHIETHAQVKGKVNAKKVETKKVKSPIRDSRSSVSQESEEAAQEPEEDLDELLAENATAGYSCFVCDRVFVDEESMKDHLQMHCEEVNEEDKGFNCAFCDEKFQTEESLETHVGEHLMENENEKISMMLKMDPPRKQKKPIFRCEQCPQVFSSSLQLAMHLPTHEDDEEEEETIEEEPEIDHFVCHICDEIFDSLEELNDHQDIHIGQSHVCILCEQSFSTIKDLQQHVSTHL